MTEDYQPTRPPQKHMKILLDRGLIPKFYKSIDHSSRFTYLAMFKLDLIENTFVCGIRKRDGMMVGFQTSQESLGTMMQDKYKQINKEEMELLSIYEEGF